MVTVYLLDGGYFKGEFVNISKNPDEPKIFKPGYESELEDIAKHNDGFLLFSSNSKYVLIPKTSIIKITK